MVYGEGVIRVDLVGVRVELPSSTPVVLLRERGGDRVVPIWIGATEAAAIAFATQGVEPPRPLTHDLLLDVVEALGRRVRSVTIDSLEGGVYRGTLVLETGEEGEPTRVDCRPSDGIAVAVRAGCPILVEPGIVDEVGLQLDLDEDGDEDAESAGEDAAEQVERFKEFLDHVSPEDFERPPS